MNHPGCLTISHKTACIWSTLGGLQRWTWLQWTAWCS